MNTNTPTFIAANKLANIKMNGFLIDLSGDVALIRRNMSPYSDADKSYVVTHYSTGSKSFYWSAYDLTLDEAVAMFNDKTQDFDIEV